MLINIWLVVDLPLWKIWVSWDDYNQYVEKIEDVPVTTMQGSTGEVPSSGIQVQLAILWLYIYIYHKKKGSKCVRRMGSQYEKIAQNHHFFLMWDLGCCSYFCQIWGQHKDDMQFQIKDQKQQMVLDGFDAMMLPTFQIRLICGGPQEDWRHILLMALSKQQMV